MDKDEINEHLEHIHNLAEKLENTENIIIAQTIISMEVEIGRLKEIIETMNEYIVDKDSAVKLLYSTINDKGN